MFKVNKGVITFGKKKVLAERANHPVGSWLCEEGTGLALLITKVEPSKEYTDDYNRTQRGVYTVDEYELVDGKVKRTQKGETVSISDMIDATPISKSEAIKRLKNADGFNADRMATNKDRMDKIRGKGKYRKTSALAENESGYENEYMEERQPDAQTEGLDRADETLEENEDGVNAQQRTEAKIKVTAKGKWSPKLVIDEIRKAEQRLLKIKEAVSSGEKYQGNDAKLLEKAVRFQIKNLKATLQGKQMKGWRDVYSDMLDKAKTKKKAKATVEAEANTKVTAKSKFRKRKDATLDEPVSTKIQKAMKNGAKEWYGKPIQQALKDAKAKEKSELDDYRARNRNNAKLTNKLFSKAKKKANATVEADQAGKVGKGGVPAEQVGDTDVDGVDPEMRQAAGKGGVRADQKPSTVSSSDSRGTNPYMKTQPGIQSKGKGRATSDNPNGKQGTRSAAPVKSKSDKRAAVRK